MCTSLPFRDTLPGLLDAPFFNRGPFGTMVKYTPSTRGAPTCSRALPRNVDDHCWIAAARTTADPLQQGFHVDSAPIMATTTIYA